MLIFLALLHSLFFSPQQIRIPGPGGHLPASGSPFTFIQATANADATAATSVVAPATGTISTGAGHCLVVFATIDTSCLNAASSNTWAITNFGGDTFNPVVPNGTGYILQIKVTVGGNYTTAAPSASVTGCTVPGSIAPTTTGSAPTITVVGFTVITVPSGCGPSLPTISFSGGTPSVNAVAVVTAVGIQGSQCSAMHYAPNIAGSTNDTVTFTHPSFAFHGLSVQEVSGPNATSPVDSEADASTTGSVSSLASGAFTTGTANTFKIQGQAVVNTALTWTAGSGSNIPSGASTSSGANFYGITTQNQTFTSVQTGVTSPSAVASKTGAFTTILVNLKQ